MLEPEDSNRRVVETIHHASASGEVVKLLCQIKVTGMEQYAEDPARHAKIAQPLIERLEQVGAGYIALDFGEPLAMGCEIED